MIEWKDVHGYEGLYTVSNQGEIRNRLGQVKATTLNVKGYRYVHLYRNYGQQGLAIHRAVAMAFVPGYEEGLQINHKDGDKLNNSADNLEWVTHEENLRHARETGIVEYKPVIAIPTKPGVGYFFRSICEAVACGFNSGNIYSVLSGRKPTHAGFVWVRPTTTSEGGE